MYPPVLKSNSISRTNSLQIGLYSGYIIIFLLLVFRVALVFSYAPEIGGIDNNFVYYVTRRLAGYSLYTDPSQFPFAITIYTPLYFDLCFLAGRAFQIDPENTISVYRLCRFVALLCDITTFYFLWLILRRNISLKPGLAVLLLASWGCILCFLGYTFSRSDSLFLTAYAATFFLLTSSKLLEKNETIFLLAILCAVCIFSKQNGISLPVLSGIWLWLLNRKRQLFLFVVSFLIFFTVISFIYSFLYGPDIFIANTVKALQNKIDWAWFYTYIFKQLTNSLLLLPLFVAFASSVYSIYSHRSKTGRALAVVFLIQFCFSLGLSLKWGSSLGYFNESFLLSFIILAGHLHRYQNKGWLNKKMLLYFLPLLFIYFIYVFSQGYLFFLSQKSEKEVQYHQELQIRQFLRPQLEGKYIFNLSNANRTFFKNLFYKEIAVPNLDMVNCCTMPDHIFNYETLKKYFQDGSIKFIVMPKGIFYKEIWGIPLSGYIKDTTLFSHDVYQYKRVL